ncbi:MFS transporter [Nocardioidaceae bacterium]|nr:MFS transporter [Nocardioidaceae bacterium]
MAVTTDATAGRRASPGPAERSRAYAVLLVVAIVAVSLNLRPAAVSVGPVLTEIRDGLGISPLVAGVLTTLPVVAFAVLGLGAPRAARVLGLHRTMLLSLVLTTLGLVGRSLVSGQVAFLVLSLLALSGAAAANILVPSLVKVHFPDRIGTLTAVYSTALAIGLTAASVATVPLGENLAGVLGDESAGGWRTALGSWAILAAVAAMPWLGLVRREVVPREEGSAISVADAARTSLGRRMALFFALQSFQAYSVFGWFAEVYRDAGFSAGEAGLLLGVITGLGIPVSFIVPSVAARLDDQRLLIVGIMACGPVAYLGLTFAPTTVPYAWAVLTGVSLAAFPLILVLIGMRARTSEGTAALSGFTQSAGYAMAALGPFAVGAMRDASGGWTLPLLVMTVLLVPQLIIGLTVAKPEFIEDELPSADGRAASR